MYKYIHLVCDDKVIELPNIEGIMLINIPSQCGGADFWANDDLTQPWLKQKSNDKCIEVIGMKDSMHLGKCIVGLSSAIRICQGKHIQVKITAPYEVPMQIDGEAFKLEEKTLELNFLAYDEVKVMKNCKYDEDKESKLIKILNECVSEGSITTKQMDIIKNKLFKIEL
jgi:hypothetical protein